MLEEPGCTGRSISRALHDALSWRCLEWYSKSITFWDLITFVRVHVAWHCSHSQLLAAACLSQCEKRYYLKALMYLVLSRVKCRESDHNLEADRLRIWLSENIWRHFVNTQVLGHKDIATNFACYQFISMQMNWKQFTHSCPVLNTVWLFCSCLTVQRQGYHLEKI